MLPPADLEWQGCLRAPPVPGVGQQGLSAHPVQVIGRFLRYRQQRTALMSGRPATHQPA